MAVLVHHAGDELRGWMREPNSFGNPVEPFLQAEIVGAWDSRGQSLQFMKTYDGVGGQSHNVLYVGRIGKDRRVAGKWEIPEVWGASFAMLPLRAERARQLLEHRPEAVTPLIPPATPRKDLFFRGGLPPATR